jgi:PPOX class probable F420-dependent enzyme
VTRPEFVRADNVAFVPRSIATETTVERAAMEDFVRARHHAVLGTIRSGGDMQMSPVTMGMGGDGSVLISSYPERAKVRNLRRRPQASVCVLSDSFGDAWVQLSGSATVVDLPDALDGLVEYFRSISGEHPDWDEYRQAMITQGKVLITIDIQRWGPISTGGFPPWLAES